MTIMEINMSENFIQHFTYEVRSPKLLSPSSSFYLEFIELCKKFDPDFPTTVDYLSIEASPGKLVEWKVHALEFPEHKE